MEKVYLSFFKQMFYIVNRSEDEKNPRFFLCPNVFFFLWVFIGFIISFMPLINFGGRISYVIIMTWASMLLVAFFLFRRKVNELEEEISRLTTIQDDYSEEAKQKRQFFSNASWATLLILLLFVLSKLIGTKQHDDNFRRLTPYYTVVSQQLDNLNVFLGTLIGCECFHETKQKHDQKAEEIDKVKKSEITKYQKSHYNNKELVIFLIYYLLAYMFAVVCIVLGNFFMLPKLDVNYKELSTTHQDRVLLCVRNASFFRSNYISRQYMFIDKFNLWGMLFGIFKASETGKIKTYRAIFWYFSSIVLPLLAIIISPFYFYVFDSHIYKLQHVIAIFSLMAWFYFFYSTKVVLEFFNVEKDIISPKNITESDFAMNTLYLHNKEVVKMISDYQNDTKNVLYLVVIITIPTLLTYISLFE